MRSPGSKPPTALAGLGPHWPPATHTFSPYCAPTRNAPLFSMWETPANLSTYLTNPSRPFPRHTPQGPLPEPLSYPKEGICLLVHLLHWTGTPPKGRGYGRANSTLSLRGSHGASKSGERHGSLRLALSPGWAPPGLCDLAASPVNWGSRQGPLPALF